ncbi:MAG: RbsD/FucU family protein [Sedimentisphaeraceae bacterium JB056]
MLKGIPNIISPELLKILMEMGHGDQLVISDGNFPGAACAQRLVRCDGHNVPEVLKAILKLFPLDTYSDPVTLMSVVPGDDYKPVIWDTYKEVIKNSGEKFDDFAFVDRFGFYDVAKSAYAVVTTSEPALYANIVLTKGVIK